MNAFKLFLIFHFFTIGIKLNFGSVSSDVCRILHTARSKLYTNIAKAILSTRLLPFRCRPSGVSSSIHSSLWPLSESCLILYSIIRYPIMLMVFLKLLVSFHDSACKFTYLLYQTFIGTFLVDLVSCHFNITNMVPEGCIFHIFVRSTRFKTAGSERVSVTNVVSPIISNSD